MHTYW